MPPGPRVARARLASLGISLWAYVVAEPGPPSDVTHALALTESAVYAALLWRVAGVAPPMAMPRIARPTPALELGLMLAPVAAAIAFALYAALELWPSLLVSVAASGLAFVGAAHRFSARAADAWTEGGRAALLVVAVSVVQGLLLGSDLGHSGFVEVHYWALAGGTAFQLVSVGRELMARRLGCAALVGPLTATLVAELGCLVMIGVALGSMIEGDARRSPTVGAVVALIGMAGARFVHYRLARRLADEALASELD